MKQQLVGEELMNGLYEVRSLLIAMNNVNKKEAGRACPGTAKNRFMVS